VNEATTERTLISTSESFHAESTLSNFKYQQA